MLDQNHSWIESPRLQTPPLSNYDNQVFPGENWFFYWKLGSGLWRSKLEEYTHPGPLLVPLNWSFHTENGEHFDFADRRPETNLKKLVDDARQIGRTLSFLLPLTPLPCLPNGGIPHLTAGNPAQDAQGVAYGIVDGDNNINKLYSFFDTKVFQAYARFTRELGSYFIRSGIDAFVWGMECGYKDRDGFKSFLFDTSPTWKKSFDNFVLTQKEASLSPAQLRYEFYELIRQTYRQQAAKDMSAHWEGVLKVGFIGSHPQNIFQQLEEKKSSAANRLEQTLANLSVSDLPSSVLIRPEQKKGCWGKMLNDIVTNGAVTQLQPSTSSPDWNNTLTPLCFFKIHHSPLSSNRTIPGWNELRLKDHLQQYYRWTYHETCESIIQKETHSEVDTESIHFFQGYDLTPKKFRQMVRLLMNDSHLILDKTSISEECSRQLESFLLENDLEVEKINLHTNIQHIKLDRTSLIIFDGSRLSELSPEKIDDFWHRLIGFFSLKHLSIQHASGVEHYWRTRLPSPEELNYEEIRRVGLYNSDNIKRKIEIPLLSNFKLLRIIDQIHGSVWSNPRQITVELEPEGSLSLDFGVFS